MLQALKNLIAELSGETQEPRPFEASDYRLAAAALLVHIASADGDYDESERERIQHLVQTRFGMSPDDAAELIEAAYESEREAVDLYRFTSVLKRHLDEDGRRQVIGMLWDMAHADGAVHEFEENIVWRVAELIGVSSRDRMALKREIRDGSTPPADGPWSQPKDRQ